MSTPASRLSVLDRALYALFSRHADHRRHEQHRRHYRATTVTTSFDVYVARVYGCSWLAFALAAGGAFALGVALPTETAAAVGDLAGRIAPGIDLPDPPRSYAAAGVAAVVGVTAKRASVWFGGRYLAWAARARRSGIERTLPGAVRYLHALAGGADDERAMLHKVADREGAYGETAVGFRKVLNTVALTGSLDRAMRRVARDTPSRDAFAPFLLKFREHADQGPDAVQSYLELEARMLGHRQQRRREQAEGFLELLAELFVVLLVLPALLVIVVTVMAVLAPGLNQPVATPLGATSVRALLVYGSAGFVVTVGAGAALLVDALRPPGHDTGGYDRADSPLPFLATSLRNPANAAVTFVAAGLAAGLLAWRAGLDPVNVALLAYAGYALPVGLVALRRARIDDAKDREIKDFVHAVSGHVSLGRPFPEAVALVADDVDLGALEGDVADLAFNLSLTSYGDELRAAALQRFVDNVGTPLADQTIGLVTGALDVGSDTETVFETLQAEIGRLHHEKKALRANLVVYVAVGWTTALLVVGIVVAVNAYVLDSFAQLSAVAGSTAGMALDPDAVQPARDRYRFYVVTQATMLACGWFAGYASRGKYEALLHSGALVAVAYVVFAGAGML
jgi:archaellum biogenesis protein FlaJ (TadC family)